MISEEKVRYMISRGREEVLPTIPEEGSRRGLFGNRIKTLEMGKVISLEECLNNSESYYKSGGNPKMFVGMSFDESYDFFKKSLVRIGDVDNCWPDFMQDGYFIRSLRDTRLHDVGSELADSISFSREYERFFDLPVKTFGTYIDSAVGWHIEEVDFLDYLNFVKEKKLHFFLSTMVEKDNYNALVHVVNEINVLS